MTLILSKNEIHHHYKHQSGQNMFGWFTFFLKQFFISKNPRTPAKLNIEPENDGF